MAEIDVAGGKEVEYLTKVQPVKIFKEIFSNFDKIFIARYAVRLADAHILAQEPDEKIFNLLVSFLEFLNSAAKINSLNLAAGFIFKFWHCLGFGSQEERYRIWLVGNWQEINELNLTKEIQVKTVEFACQHAQTHSGRRIARFVGVC